MSRPVVPKRFLSHRERCDQFGIDCGGSLIWQGWSIGGEYNKVVTFRNVGRVVKTLRYRLPSSTTFSMEFPQAVRLHPGMSFSTTVSFRPLAHIAVTDCIEVLTEDGSFSLPIRASVPGLDAIVPTMISFGFRPAQSTSSHEFQVENTSDMDANFQWDVPTPYCIEPRSAMVAAGAGFAFRCDFSPTIASVFNVEAICTISNGQEQKSFKTQITAISKYPHLSLGQTDWDFGSVSVGKVVQKDVELINHSSVEASFTLHQLNTDHGSVFSVDLQQSTVPANESIPISISYNPRFPNETPILDTFQIQCQGGNQLELTLRGTCKGASYSIDHNFIDFDDVELGVSSHRALTLENLSDDCTLRYKLDIGSGAFKCVPDQGEIRPSLSATIKVSFVPRDTINYYDRIYLLVENGISSYIDIFGTCFKDAVRPPPFKLDQIKAHHQFLSERDPRITDEYINHEGTSSFVRILESDEGLQFGSCPTIQGTQTKNVHVQNDADAKINIVWDIPLHDLDRTMPFLVIPRQRDVQPHTIAQFQVVFRPIHDNVYYDARLVCTANYKVNRSFRLVNNDSFVPPWRPKIQILGNSFRPAAEQFLRHGGFRTHRIEFPACQVNCHEYRIVRLLNSSNTPMQFKFMSEDLSASGGVRCPFKVKPLSGSIAANSFHLIALAFSPVESCHPVHLVRCLINNSEVSTLHLVATAHRVELVSGSGHHIRFNSVSVGTATSTEFVLRNPTRIPAAFTFIIDPSDRDQLQVEPISGMLMGHESLRTKWTFRPFNKGKHSMNIDCLVGPSLPIHVPGHALKLVAHGNCQSIVVGFVDKASISDPSVLGEPSYHRLTLRNLCDVDVAYSIRAIILDSDNLDEKHQPEISISNGQGVLASRFIQSIDVHVTMWTRSVYHVRVECISAAGSAVFGYCDLQGESVLPELRVRDVRIEGVPPSASWQQSNAEAINNALQSDLSEFEWQRQRDGNSTKTPTNEYLQKILPAFDCSFMPCLLGYPPSVMTLNLYNPGKVDAEWDLRGPQSIDLDTELWVDPDTQSPEEKEQQKIVEKRIFTVAPTKGQLASGQSVNLILTCSHRMPDASALVLVRDID